MTWEQWEILYKHASLNSQIDSYEICNEKQKWNVMENRYELSSNVLV